MTRDPERETAETDRSKMLRRGVLRVAGALAIGTTTAGVGSAEHRRRQDARGRAGDSDVPQNSVTRMTKAYRLRQGAAREQLLEQNHPIEYEAEERLEGAINRYTKCLPHDGNGEPDVSAYETLIDALQGTADYAEIPLSDEAERPLENPSAANGYTWQGADPYQIPIPPNPAFDSAGAATEMVELYWMSLARDIPFSEYGSNQTIQDAAAELSTLDSEHELEISTTAENLFRGPFPGVQQGPHISQFLYRPIQHGTALTIDQQYNVQEPGDTNQFLTDFDDWLSIQRGAAPTASITRVNDSQARYLTTARDLVTYVHANVPFQAYLQAAIALFTNGAPLDVDGTSVATPNDDRLVESQFIDYGPCEALSTCTGAMRDVQRWTWANKWAIHQRLRPEEFGGRIEVHLDDDRDPEYPIDDAVLDSEALSRVDNEYGTHLLPHAYPEGSPTHPSYPAGHGTIEGCGIGILKAFFDTSATVEEVFGDVVVPSDDGTSLESYDGVDASDITVADELNKLASNMARGRDMAGIHYWTDGVEGVRYGEEFAIAYLRDQLRTQEIDQSVSLTTVDGENVNLT